MDRALQQSSGSPGQVVDHAAAVRAAGRRSGCRADRGVHLLQPSGDPAGVGPAAQDGLRRAAVGIVAGECGCRLLVGAGEAAVGFECAVELLAQAGERSALSHSRHDGGHAALVGSSRFADTAHDRGSLAEGMERIEGGMAGPDRASQGAPVALVLRPFFERREASRHRCLSGLLRRQGAVAVPRDAQTGEQRIEDRTRVAYLLWLAVGRHAAVTAGGDGLASPACAVLPRERLRGGPASAFSGFGRRRRLRPNRQAGLCLQGGEPAFDVWG